MARVLIGDHAEDVGGIDRRARRRRSPTTPTTTSLERLEADGKLGDVRARIESEEGAK